MSDRGIVDVSRETKVRLETYQALLVKWQARINLVAPDTLADSWDRHFVDSLQLIPHLPPSPFSLVDMGTGAGFPGLVLAIACPNAQAHLIESDAKKCEFLKTVSRETGLMPIVPATPQAQISPDPGLRRDDPRVAIHTARIEAVEPFFVDVITARALASLTELLGYALSYAQVNPSLKMIYLKGARWQEEIDAARDIYMFDVQSFESLTSKQSRVLIISGLRMRGH